MSDLREGLVHEGVTQLTEQQILAARKKYLIKMRVNLGWSAEQMAAKLGVTVPEYESYEEGRSRDLPELEFEDVKFYLEQHLKVLEGDK
jgi:DNA-binding XRE family transcriptional regulator